MSVFIPLHLFFTAVALGWWGWQVLRMLEWRDRHADRSRARQNAMTVGTWSKTNVVAKHLHRPIRWLALGVGFLIIMLSVTRPALTYLVAPGAALYWARHRTLEPGDIARLRLKLGNAIGRDAKGRPPAVTVEATRPDGQPSRLAIKPYHEWRHWNTAGKKELDDVIQEVMLGDWERVEYDGDGGSTWERLPELPSRFDYPGHLESLPWYQIPIGIEGDSGPGIADLSIDPHWLVAGATGWGKTSVLRVMAAHLLSHEVTVVALDIKYSGLAFLEGRQGVFSAMSGLESIETALVNLRQDVENRQQFFKQTRQYRPPIVIFIDEVQKLFNDARQWRKKPAGMKEPELIMNVHQIAQIGRSVDVHLILATQRPDSDEIGGALRDQCEGRIGVGQLTQAGATMLFEKQADRARSTPRIKGRQVIRNGDRTVWMQGCWLADPIDPRHPVEDRRRAEQMLPNYLPGFQRDVMDHEQAEQVWSQLTGQSGQGLDLTKIVVDDDGNVVDAPKVKSKAKSSAERSKAYRDRLQIELAADPNHRMHGTPSGRHVCICPVCRPEKHSTPQRQEARA